MRRQYDSPQTSKGFALVGVVMFVLVLTILGLSLFSLTSFESQFLTMSESRSEAFFAASDAIDRARFTLVATNSLQSVYNMLPDGTVIYARAKQGHELNFKDLKDSTGTVDWDGSNGDVWIRTLAVRRGQRTLLEARFTPHDTVDYYRRLMTLSGDLTVKTDGDPPPDPRVTVLAGEVWKNGPGPYPVGTIPVGSGTVATPNVQAYIASYYGLAQPVSDDHPSPNRERYTLDASGSQYKFFRSSGAGNWSINSLNQKPEIQVSGLAIWLLDHGIRAVDKMDIHGPPGSALMIVAGQTSDNGLDDDRGINFLGGADTNIPVILVSDGIVGIEHKNNTLFEPSLMGQVSIYSRDAVFLGTKFGFGAQTVGYQPVVGQIISTLYGLDLLPNMSNGVLSRLEREPGTWRDITESNPN